MLAKAAMNEDVTSGNTFLIIGLRKEQRTNYTPSFMSIKHKMKNTLIWNNPKPIL